MRFASFSFAVALGLGHFPPSIRADLVVQESGQNRGNNAPIRDLAWGDLDREFIFPSAAALREACLIGFVLLVGGTPTAPGPPSLLAATPPFSLSPFYALEQLLMQNESGRRLAALYWQHSAELVQIVKTNLALVPSIAGVMSDFQPGVARLLSGTGESFQITQSMVDRLNNVWDQLRSLASPELKQALETVRALAGFRDFVGKDFNQWAQLLGIVVPNQPFIYASSPRREAGQFKVEGNHVAGLTYSLWRTLTLPNPAWQAVPNAQVQPESYTVTLTDPAPPSTGAFYRVQAVQTTMNP